MRGKIRTGGPFSCDLLHMTIQEHHIAIFQMPACIPPDIRNIPVTDNRSLHKSLTAGKLLRTVRHCNCPGGILPEAQFPVWKIRSGVKSAGQIGILRISQYKSLGSFITGVGITSLRILLPGARTNQITSVFTVFHLLEGIPHPLFIAERRRKLCTVKAIVHARHDIFFICRNIILMHHSQCFQV